MKSDRKRGRRGGCLWAKGRTSLEGGGGEHRGKKGKRRAEGGGRERGGRGVRPPSSVSRLHPPPSPEIIVFSGGGGCEFWPPAFSLGLVKKERCMEGGREGGRRRKRRVK